jgi:hypothetical protein
LSIKRPRHLDFSRLPHASVTARWYGLVHLVAPTAKIAAQSVRADGSWNSFISSADLRSEHGAKDQYELQLGESSAELTHAIDYASMHG